jgi:hypothetical protein
MPASTAAGPGRVPRRAAAGLVPRAGPLRPAERVRREGQPGLAEVLAGCGPVRVRPDAHPLVGPAAGDPAGHAERHQARRAGPLHPAIRAAA